MKRSVQAISARQHDLARKSVILLASSSPFHVNWHLKCIACHLMNSLESLITHSAILLEAI